MRIISTIIVDECANVKKNVSYSHKWWSKFENIRLWRQEKHLRPASIWGTDAKTYDAIWLGCKASDRGRGYRTRFNQQDRKRATLRCRLWSGGSCKGVRGLGPVVAERRKLGLSDLLHFLAQYGFAQLLTAHRKVFFLSDGQFHHLNRILP